MRALTAASVQDATVSKQALKTWTTSNGNQAVVITSSLRSARLTAVSIQVATVRRSVSSIRLALSSATAVKRFDIAKTISIAQPNTGVILIAVIRPNFIQPRGSLLTEGGDFTTTTVGGSIRFTSSGEIKRLSSSPRSSTLITTGI
jgi:hypothetical protein